MPSYIKRVLGKAAGIASALTLGVLSYTAAPAKAENAPKKIEDPNLVQIVADSYAQEEKGKERDNAIQQLITSAYQDPAISSEDRAYITRALAQKISNPTIKKQLAELAANYNAMQMKTEAARRKYQQELRKAEKQEGKEKTETLVKAKKTYYKALSAAEQAVPKTQYAQEMLELAKEAWALSQEILSTCEHSEIQDGNWIQNSKKAVEQAAKEEHLLSFMLQYDSAIETALSNAEQERTAAGKINWYRHAIDTLKQAEEIFPYAQFDTHIAELGTLIKGLKSADEKKPSGEKPPEEEGKEKTPEEKQPGAGKTPAQPKAGQKDDAGKNKDDGFTGKGAAKQADTGASIADIFAGIIGEKYDTRFEYRQGLMFEDKDGDRESLYGILGKTLELALLREYIHKRNAADNIASEQTLAGYMELSPLAILRIDPEALKIGGMLEHAGNKEWAYNEAQLSDTPTETETKTANIRNFINNGFGSFWLDAHIPNLVKAKLALMLDSTSLVTEEDSLTWHENNTDPSASYGETGHHRTSDRFSKQAVSAVLGIPFEFVTKGKVKGFFGASLDRVIETMEFTGTPRETADILKPGLRAELYVNDDFGIAMTFLQDLQKEEGEDTRKAKTYRGQIAAALNLGTIQDEDGNPLFKAMLFGHGWVAGYEDDVKTGGGIGAMLGSDVIKDISSIVQLLYDKDSSKTGSRPELSDEMHSFLERKGFNHLPVGIIDGKNKYGFALIAYCGAGKATGMHGKTVTETFGEISAVLDTPAIALIASGYYADMALERQWGLRFRADIKRGLLRGFAGAIEFNQSNYLPTDELERELALAFEVPLGADEE